MLFFDVVFSIYSQVTPLTRSHQRCSGVSMEENQDKKQDQQYKKRESNRSLQKKVQSESRSRSRSIQGMIQSEFGWRLLYAIADGMEFLENATRRPSATLHYGSDLRALDKERERRRKEAALRRMRRNEIIEKKKKSGRRAYQLTELGEELLRSKKLPEQLPKGQKTIVSFDVPEQHKSTRQTFRRFLKAKGFQKAHRSVWVSDRDWAGLLQKELERLEIGDWVIVMQGKIL